MMRRTAALGLLLAACSGGTADTTVPVPEPTTTTTTVEEPSTTTTTMTVAEAVDICRSGTAIVWKPGQTHVATCFLLPLSFTPREGGWRTFSVQEDRLHVTLAEAGAPVAEVAILAYRPSAGLDAVADSILALEGPTVVADPTDVTLNGKPAVTFDVSTPPDPSSEPGWNECHTLSLGTVIAAQDGPGWRLFEGGLDGTDAYGLAPCRTFRVWVVEIAGVTVTFIATADEEPTLREAMPTIERHLDSMTFEAP